MRNDSTNLFALVAGFISGSIICNYFNTARAYFTEGKMAYATEGETEAHSILSNHPLLTKVLIEKCSEPGTENLTFPFNGQKYAINCDWLKQYYEKAKKVRKPVPFSESYQPEFVPLDNNGRPVTPHFNDRSNLTITEVPYTGSGTHADPSRPGEVFSTFAVAYPATARAYITRKQRTFRVTTA